MLIYCKYLKHPIYDIIKNYVNFTFSKNKDVEDTKERDEQDKDIILNAIPIKYNNKFWLLTNISEIEISSLLLNNKKYEITYFENEKINGTIIINKICSLHELHLNNYTEDIDCLYDEHLDIMFIKIKNLDIEYIDIGKCENTILSLLNDFVENRQIINIKWINNLMENKQINSPINKIIFDDNFINLPSIPYIVSELTNIDNFDDICNIPCSGGIITTQSEEFLGLISYVNGNKIVSIPNFLIIKSLNYIEKMGIYKLNLDLIPIKIILKDVFNKDIYNYGVYYIKKKTKKNEDKSEKLYGKMCNIILSIDNYLISSSGDLIIDNKEIPITAYLWLIKTKENLKIKGISSTCLKNNCIINDEVKNTEIIDCRNINNIKFSYYNLKLNYNLDNCMTMSNINYIKYGKKYLIEINEKIMQILKKVIMNTENLNDLYDYVYENKFLNKQVVIFINNYYDIKIIKKIKNKTIKNLNTITSYFKNSDSLKNYIKNI
jgi:hypothetical protein